VARPAQLRCGQLEVDLETDHATVHGGMLELRRLELKVLVYLLRNSRRWIAVKELQRQVLGTYGGGGSVRTHIGEIRNKLGRCGARVLTQSAHGKGYRVVAPEPQRDEAAGQALSAAERHGVSSHSSPFG
jgi:DNA-binding response OmpR family regulator